MENKGKAELIGRGVAPWRGVRSGSILATTTEVCSDFESHLSAKQLEQVTDMCSHAAIYKNRGHPYKMYGLDGKTYYGECIMFTGDTFECPNAFGGMKSGVRMFRCLTQWTVSDIERAN